PCTLGTLLSLTTTTTPTLYSLSLHDALPISEIFGQMHPIISQMWLFCQNGQLNVITGLFQYRFDEFMPHHAMPNHENFHICTPTIVFLKMIKSHISRLGIDMSAD